MKNDEDSSSEEEKQWVSTKEKLLKRMGKKDQARYCKPYLLRFVIFKFVLYLSIFLNYNKMIRFKSIFRILTNSL